jgi:phospholipid-transporting ATPase
MQDTACKLRLPLQLHPLRSTMNSDESFAALVNTANPATSGYGQRENNPFIHSDYNTHITTPGYPPQPNLMDPFFDDDDDDASHSNFAMYSAQRPMQSQESGLPLARSAAPPAGIGASSASLAITPNGQPQGWAFDDDSMSPAFSPAPSFPAEPSSMPMRLLKRRRKWKWPWQRGKELVGERVIAVNNPLMNDDYCSNFVSTSKYNMVSFLPKFLTGLSHLVLRTPHNIN